MLGGMLRAFASGRKDDWDVWRPYAVFAMASTLGCVLTPSFIDRGQHPRLPLSLLDFRTVREPAAEFAARMKALEQEVQALLHAAQQESARNIRRLWTRAGWIRRSRWATRWHCCGTRSSIQRRSAISVHGGRATFLWQDSLALIRVR